MTPDELYAIIGIAAAGCGFISGIAVGAGTVVSKNKDLEAHGKAIESIASRCDRQKEMIMGDLKQTVCDAMKVAIRDLRGEIREKQAETDRDLAVVAERVSQADRDIETIFSRVRDLERK